MKYLPDNNQFELTKGLERKLKEYRATRSFDPEKYTLAKIELIKDYLEEFGVKSVVLGVSGGVDSAVVFKLLNKVEGLHLQAVSIPAKEYTSRQYESTERALELSDSSGYFLEVIDISPVVKVLHETVGREGSPWAFGQLVSNLRATTLHHVATLSNDAGDLTVVGGTTNLDEGGYIGYVGKMSDGLVDVQFISDLHKSEVYELAHYLGVPESILEVTPTGDMFDSRTDADVFGTSYDHLELLRPRLNDPEEFFNGLSDEDLAVWSVAEENLQGLHEYNSHKYEITLPSFFLDVLPSHVEGGWSNTPWRKE